MYALNALTLMVSINNKIIWHLVRLLLTVTRAWCRFLKHRQYQFHLLVEELVSYTNILISSHIRRLLVVLWIAITETLVEEVSQVQLLMYKWRCQLLHGKLKLRIAIFLGIQKQFAYNVLQTMLQLHSKILLRSIKLFWIVNQDL